MNGEDQPRSHRASNARVAIMLAAGVISALGAGAVGWWPYAASIGWATACLVYIVWVWVIIARKDGESTRNHASQEDPDRTTSDTLLLLASVAGLAALFIIASQAKSAPPIGKELLTILAVTSIVLSWFFVHTLYTLRYAVLYYADKNRPIDFNQDLPPRYLDFAYLSFTIGMTFQVSDTTVSSTVVRAAILRHMLLSYLFGAVILAVAVNVIGSLAQ